MGNLGDTLFEAMAEKGSDPIAQSMLANQRLAKKIGGFQMSMDVYQWAIRHAMHIPAPALTELVEIIAPREEK